MNEYGILVRRKPVEDCPVMTCAICGETHAPLQPQFYYRDERFLYAGARSVCRSCAARWGSGFGSNVTGVSRADRFAMQRLKAVTTALAWEVMNGGQT